MSNPACRPHFSRLRLLGRAAVLTLALVPLVPTSPARAAQEGAGGAGTVFEAIARDQGGARSARVRLITDNPEAWASRWALLTEARTTIDCTSYLMHDDVYGRSFLGLLQKKAKEGVQVRMMLDGRGASAMVRTLGGKDLLQELAALPGATVKVFNPIPGALVRALTDPKALLASNHDKLLIVDGRWLMTGGRNISRDYMAAPADHPKAYRDTDVLVDDPVVARAATGAFEVEFDKPCARLVNPDMFGNWSSQARALDLARRAMQAHLLGEAPSFPVVSAAAIEARALASEVARDPALKGLATAPLFHGDRGVPSLLLDKQARIDEGPNHITDNLVRLIDSARSEILLQNPYVVLSAPGREALVRAARRGVRVVLHTNGPDSTNHPITQVPFLDDWKGLVTDITGLRLHVARPPRLLHAKVFVFDRAVAAVGTYNLDPLSESINSEQILLVNAPDFAERCARRIEAEIAEGHQYRLRQDRDGATAVAFGPEHHVPAATLKSLRRMSWARWLRPVL